MSPIICESVIVDYVEVLQVFQLRINGSCMVTPREEGMGDRPSNHSLVRYFVQFLRNVFQASRTMFFETSL